VTCNGAGRSRPLLSRSADSAARWLCLADTDRAGFSPAISRRKSAAASIGNSCRSSSAGALSWRKWSITGRPPVRQRAFHRLRGARAPLAAVQLNPDRLPLPSRSGGTLDQPGPISKSSGAICFPPRMKLTTPPEQCRTSHFAVGSTESRCSSRGSGIRDLDIERHPCFFYIFGAPTIDCRRADAVRAHPR
jgi:hypothetical protein